MSEFWYYAEGDETRGPIAFDQLIELLSQLPTPRGVLVWRKGFAEWTAAENVREIAENLSWPPPLPKSSPLPSQKPVSNLSPEYQAMNVLPEKPKRNGLHIVVGFVACVLIYALAHSVGSYFSMVIVLIWLSYWIFTKLMPNLFMLRVQTSIALMLAVLLGHTLWIVAGHAILLSTNKPSQGLEWFAIDLAVVVVALIWCLKKQSVASCVFVLLYEFVGFTSSIVNFNDLSKVSVAVAWIHPSLRAIGCGLAIYAIVKAGQPRQDDDPLPLLAIEPKWAGNPYWEGTPQAEEWEKENTPR
jgi:hypothetical protein